MVSKCDGFRRIAVVDVREAIRDVELVVGAAEEVEKEAKRRARAMRAWFWSIIAEIRVERIARRETMSMEPGLTRVAWPLCSRWGVWPPSFSLAFVK